MTTVLPSRQTSGEKELADAQSTGQADGAAADAPVIVLTYKHGGSDRLWSLLTGHPGLVCTIGTGLLPLCEQAAATWRYVDGRKDTPMSALAANSIRAMATAVITTVLARYGGQRWCEFSTAPRSTDAFLRSGNRGPDVPFRDSPPTDAASHARFPADDVPAPLLAQADRLNRKLGYPCLTPDPRP